MKTTLMTMVLTLAFIACSAMAQTDQQQTRPAPRWKQAKGANELKLTDEQKKDIQKIKLDLMQKQIDIRAKIAHARLDYEQLASADSPDEEALAAKMDEISKLQTQLKKNMLDGWFAVNKILTPDQQKIWKRVLEHPGLAARRVMMRIRTGGRNGGNGMMMWRRPGIGLGPMMNGGQTFGEGLNNDDLDSPEMDYLGPMADVDLFSNDPLSGDLEIFDSPMMDNMNMMDHFNMMGPDGIMKNRLDMMKKMMEQNLPDAPPPDSSK